MAFAANPTRMTGQATNDWSEFHRTNMRRWNPFENVLNVNNAWSLGLKWSFTTGNIVASSPAVASGVVYLGSWDGNVYALSATTGTKLWSYATGAPVAPSPAVANGMAYVGSYNGNVYGLSATTGTKLWSYVTGVGVYSSPTVTNGVVYIGSQDGSIYALNAITGVKLWSYATGAAVDSSPAVADGVVYVGSEDGSVYALNASTGAKLWAYATGSIVDSSPAVANGVVYIGSLAGSVYALDVATGAKVWSYSIGGYVDSSLTIWNGVVYAGSGNGNVYALNAGNGATLWTYTTGGAVESSPAVANGVLYVGSWDGNVYALSATTGAKLWSYATGGWVTSSPAVVNGAVYVGSWDDKIYTFSSSAQFLSFPLRNRNASNAKIITVFDHSSNWQYCGDNIVEAYDGEKGELAYGKNKYPAKGYCNGVLNALYGFAQGSDYKAFSINGQYIGADGDGSGHSGVDFLQYDGHPGYDFETVDQSNDGKIPVLASSDGTVVCTHVPSDCTDGTRTDLCVEGPGEIKIKHPNGYFSVYLHLSQSSVTQGEPVLSGQQIGISGSTGTPQCASPHLHFEMRKGKPGCDTDTTCACNRAQTQQVNNCVPVDPYGWLGDPAKDPYTHNGTKVQNIYLWK